MVLLLEQKADRHQFLEVIGAIVAAGNPADHMQVTQSAGGAFQVGFEIVFGLVELAVAGCCSL